MKCKHENFGAAVDVHRVAEKVGDPIEDYHADVRINCADCGLAFKFIGMKSGLDYRSPTVRIDGLEASLPIRPSDEKTLPPPPKIRGFGIKFNGEEFRP